MSFLKLWMSTVPVNVVRVKSYVSILSFNHSTRVPVRVLVNKLNLVSERMPGLILACSETAEI